VNAAAPADEERVLILAPTSADAALSRSILAEARLRCEVCRDLAALTEALHAGAGSLLLTDEVPAAWDARLLVEALEAQPSWSDLPVLLLAESGADSSAAAWALEMLGNVTILERPVRVTTLVSALRTAIRARRRQYELRDQLVELRRKEEQVRSLNERLLVDLGRLTRLQQVSTRLVQTTHLAELLEEILDAAIEITAADKGNIQLFEGGALRIVAHRGFERPFLEFFRNVKDGSAACGAAMLARERVIIDDVTTHPIFADTPAGEVLLAAGVHAVQATPLLSRSGHLLGMFSTHYRTALRCDDAALPFFDMLARQAADFIERVQGEEALKEADRRKDEFLATLAHELRNPLAPIRNALHIMQIAPEHPATMERVRGLMERQLVHMVRLIDDLLDVSRITRGKLQVRKERVDLASVIGSAIDTVRPLIDAAGHVLNVDIPSQPIYLDADPMRLAQVFSNLLSNAAKYTDRGGRIDLTAAPEGNEIVVKVRDSGMGIPAHALPTIFDMFTQVDPSQERSQGGLGIGLTLVRQLVHMHGGSVEASSGGVGEGAEFTTRLPIASPSLANEPPTAESSSGHRLSYRILVVDDNLDAAETTGTMLRMIGNEVRIVHDGILAVEETAGFRPDVILMDIGMPGLNGYEAARRIRDQPWGKKIVLVALTGWGQEEDKRRAREAGFDHHFTKPVDPRELDRLLQRLPPHG
jgi:signal transduction histidine kinase/DNA-binding response OmpR family regulator